MSEINENPYLKREPYVPATLSEIYDYLAGTLGRAPTFIDETDFYSSGGIDTEFSVLVSAFGNARLKLGEDRYAKLIELAARTKALFLADPNDDNGKTVEGCKLIWEMENIIQDARKHRVKAKFGDDEGKVTGD